MQSKKKVIASYDIATDSGCTFKVTFIDNNGLREFDIVLDGNGSDNYSEIFSNSFYKNFVIPWVYNGSELPTTNNVVDINEFKQHRQHTKTLSENDANIQR